MNEGLGLKILAEILEWADEANTEYPWLKFMARYKYDGYQDFVAGKRFIASLIGWLKQFPSVGERRAAYAFVRERLVYFGPAEMNHLVRLSYPEAIQPQLIAAVAARLNIEPYLVWSHPEGWREYQRVLRASLFFGLSDGARIDVFRRANTGVISNEQVLVAPQIHASKWKSVLKKLQKDAGDSARFEFVFLLDDFTASGATFVRFDHDEQEWTGKLVRFWEDVSSHIATHFSPGWTLSVHHYVASHDAVEKIKASEALIRSVRDPKDWFNRVTFTYGTQLPESTKLNPARDAEFLALVDKYYDPVIQNKHTDVGGTSVARGFSDCALPVVMDHNTPNNSVALLWAETPGGSKTHSMRPLFRRRQRHL